MATNKREVELIIKANNLSQKTLKEVGSAVSKISEEITSQVNAAKKGEGSIAALNRAYGKLNDASKALTGQQALVDRFVRIAGAVDDARDKASRAATAYAALAEEQSYQSVVTAKQDKELAKLAKSQVAAEKALSDQQASLAKVSAELERAGIATDSLATDQAQLVATAKSLSQVYAQSAASLDAYEKNARAASDAEKARVFALNATEAAMRSLGNADAALRKVPESFDAIQAEITSTKTKLETLEASARSAYAQLSAPGLTPAQMQATATSLDKTIAKLNQTQRELRELETAAERANIALAKNPFDAGGRTTLSLLQRIRGELLAVTAAYVGLQGTISGVGSVLSAVRQDQQIQSALLVANGNDAKAAGDDYKYLRQQAERLGIFFPVLAKQYSQFGVAAKQANMESKDLRFVFERVAEAGKVMNLDEENLQGIFNAITQMVSKGKIQTEELRGQLGDRLPGALQFAAKQYEGGVKEFVKQLELGNVEATNGVINLARGLDAAFNAQLEQATKNVSSQEARFKTSVSDFQKTIADAGLEKAYGELLEALTKFFKSDEGKRFAEGLARAFTAVSEALIFLIENAETVEDILYTVGALLAMRAAFSGVVAIKDYTDNLVKMNTELGKSTSLLGKLEAGFILAQAAILSFSLGKYLQDTNAEIKKIGIGLAAVINTTLRRIQYAVEVSFTTITSAFSDTYSQKVKALTAEMNRDINAYIAAANEQLGELDKKYQQAKAQATLARGAKGQPERTPDRTGDPGGNKAEFSTDPEAATNKLQQLLNQVEAVEASSLKKQSDSIASIIAGIEKQYEALFRKINSSGLEGAAQLQVRLRAAVDMLKAEAEKNYGEAELRKIESIQNRFAQIEGQLGRSSLGTLDDRLGAIDAKYKALYTDIAQLDGQRKIDLQAQLDIMIEQLKVVEQEKFAQDQLQESQKKINDLITERDARIRTVSDLVTAGLKTEAEGRELIKGIIEDTQPAIEAAADAGIALVETLRGLVDDGTLDMIAAKFELAKNSANGLKTELYSAAQANKDLAAGLTDALSKSAEGFGKAIAGAQSFGEAIKGTGKAFVQFAADFLRKIAEMILQQIILNAISGTGVGGFISGSVGKATVKHDGGLVSSPGRSRAVSGSLFSNAPRYHSGGMAGLAPDEVPAILQRNEEVLTRDDPRHRLNGGANQAPIITPAPEVRVINTIDSGSFVSEGINTPSGSKAVLNWVRANKSSMKTILG